MSSATAAVDDASSAVATNADVADAAVAASLDDSILSTFTHGAIETAPTSSIAMVLMFGSIIFATVSLASRTWLMGDLRAINAALDPRSSALNTCSYESLYTLLHHFSVLGLILLFAYICEYHPPFPHAEKSYDRDEFFFLTAILFVVSAYTVHRNDGKDVSALEDGQDKKVDGQAATAVASVTSASDGDDEGSMASIGSNNVDDNSLPTATSISTGRRLRRRGGRRGDLADASRPRAVAESVPANDVLNRDQTEEWKGWMQFIFLLYHYYSASETYNSIRIMITCYVWMTGFGNFSFFYLKADFSAVRVLQMLWRLNFLVIFLMLSQGTTYILYYICPLHTYFFLMVYFTMRVGKDLNYQKYGIRWKLMAVAFLVYIFWDLDSGLFKMFHAYILDEKPMIGATGGSMWEWYFRTTLDHWSTFLGMIFALNYPITSLWFRKLEAQPKRLEVLGKGIVGLVILGCFIAWVAGPFQEAKLEYNATNAYFGFVPLITYIYFRNLTPKLRQYSLDLLHQIGKTTLETYLMQHHIWLTSNAKSLLTLIPGYPRVNMLLVTIIYFHTSRRLYKLTLFLRGMLLPDNRSACFKSLISLFGIVGGFHVFALTLEAYGLTSLRSVAIICVVCGFVLYQTVVDRSWDIYRKSAPLDATEHMRSEEGEEEIERPNFETPITRITPPIYGAMVLFVLGLTWHGMAESGAGKIQPLPEQCSAFANDGQWVPIDACNEATKAQAYRDYGTVGFATCGASSGMHIWGWNETDPSTYCRFARRDSKQLKKTLNKRSLLFIGDSMTRLVYHATLRALGVAGSGAYDATGPKHVDIVNEVGSINVDFQWAPLASDQLGALKAMNEQVAKGTEWERGFPDLIVIGGGTWDRLHQFATDADQQAVKETLRELKSEISTIKEEGAPVTWLVPTTINDRALNTEEKRDHMTEDDMEDMRDIYAEIGVSSACSFVIEGPAFTRSRVKESYDGVHYPPQVYDAGAQILANAMDWLLPERDDTVETFVPLQPGRMSNPYLGLMMLCFVFVGLMFFDGFMGFSYLASLCVGGIMPNELFEEAFTTLHQKANLPMDGIIVHSFRKSSRRSTGFSARRTSNTSHGYSSDRSEGLSVASGTEDEAGIRSRRAHSSVNNAVDDEIAALLEKK